MSSALAPVVETSIPRRIICLKSRALQSTVVHYANLVSEFVVPVKLVQQAMHDRSEHQRRGQDKDETRVEGIDSGKQLSGVRVWRINRPHAAQEHGCVKECVSP